MRYTRLFSLMMILIAVFNSLFDGKAESDIMVNNDNSCFFESNYNQIESNTCIWIGVENNNIYYYSNRSSFKYKNCLCVFSAGEHNVLKTFGNKQKIKLIGLIDNYIYYWIIGPSKSKKDELFWYNTMNGSEQKVYQGVQSNEKPYYVKDSMLYIPIEINATTKFLCMFKGNLVGCDESEPYYSINDMYYYASAGSPSYGESALAEHIYHFTEIESCNELKLSPANHRILIECGDGLIVHNDGFQDILYYIDDVNTIHKIITIECMASRSAVAVIGDVAYISIKRYEQLGPMSIGMIRFTNDSVEGIYEVQPFSGRIKKISDLVFDVIYVYDNTHIIGCDEKMNIWLFDLENMVSTLLF